jgi:hypothetical protein
VPTDQRTGDYDAKQQLLIRGMEELQQSQRKRQILENQTRQNQDTIKRNTGQEKLQEKMP